MKHTIRILAVLLAVLMLAGCVQTGPEATDPSASEPTKDNNSMNPGDLFGPKPDDATAPTGGGNEQIVVEAEDSLLFRPVEAGTGDVTPIYHDGKYYVFFLHSTKYRWCYMTTTDFVNYSDITVLRNFGGTGDVLYVDGTWHIFASLVEEGNEIIHHYTGETLETMRDTYQTIPASGEFSSNAWRDPRVWYDETVGKYRMLVTTNYNDKNSVNRNGAIATLTSDDLYNWTVEGPWFAPGFYSGSCECPDYFKMGDWYYTVYSDCSYGKRTYYVKSKSPNGPWEIPDDDLFDSLFFYAAKTVSDGENRYALGWAGDRSGATLELDASFTQIDPDFATIKYAGTMIVHKIEQLPNGDLVAVPVQEQIDSFTTAVKNKFTPLQGDWQTGDDWARVTCENGYAALLMQNVPDSCTFSFKLKVDAKQAGIALNVNSTFADKGYHFVFDRQYNRLKHVSGALSGVMGYYFPYDTELERPITFEDGKIYDVTVLVDGPIAIVYVDGECALTTRMTTTTGLALGLFCYAGSAEFTDFTMHK